MRFEYYRFLLTPERQKIFNVSVRERQDVIKQIFSARDSYMFQYGRSTYGFVIKDRRGKKIFGRIGKQTSAKLSSSPETGFQEREEENWPGSHIFINLDDEKSTGNTEQFGQVIAVQSNRRAISNMGNCLRTLADKINREIADTGLYISINPILQKSRGFWNVVNEHSGKIRKVILIYTPPNLFDLQNKLEEDLKDVNKRYNTTSTQIVLKNDRGDLKLQKDDRLLNESARYIGEGAGRFRVYAKRHRVIKSEAGVRTEEFSDITIEADKLGESEWDMIENVLKRTKKW